MSARDRFRDEEHWGEAQAGEYAAEGTQRVPTGGSNERPCPRCGVMLMVHVRGVCPTEQRKDDAA